MKDRFGFERSDVPASGVWSRPVLGRRRFFRHAAAALGGYFLLPARPMERLAGAATSPAPAAKNCIFVLMAGGPSHTDTFDLKEGPWMPAEFDPTTYGEIRFPRGLMPAIAGHLDSIVLLRSVRAWTVVHGPAQSWLRIGRAATSLTTTIPHPGEAVTLEMGDRSENSRLPAFISLHASGGAGDPAGFDLHDPLLIQSDDEDDGAAAFAPPGEIFTFDPGERARYGGSRFGMACLAARNLVRSRLGVRFVQINMGGWDNHSSIYEGALNAAEENSVARRFDAGLGALLADLKAEGLLSETLVVAMGEFGRTAGPLNPQGGRDHLQQQSVLLAGGGIRGRRAIGVTDAEGRETLEPGWCRHRDIRPEDLKATLYAALGIDWTTVRRDDLHARRVEYIPSADRGLYGPVQELWA